MLQVPGASLACYKCQGLPLHVTSARGFPCMLQVPGASLACYKCQGLPLYVTSARGFPCMLQVPGASLACSDIAFALTAICHWQGRSSLSQLYFILN